MEELANKLKGERSRLKARITSLSNQLERSIIVQSEDINSIYKEIEGIFGQFTEVHEQYKELVDNDDTLESFRKVSGMDCEDYFKAAEDVVTKATDKYVGYVKECKLKKASNYKLLISPLYDKAKSLIENDKAGSLQHTSDTFANIDVLLRSMKDFSQEVLCISELEPDLVSNIELCINDLEVLCIKYSSDNFSAKPSIVQTMELPGSSLTSKRVGSVVSAYAGGSPRSALPRIGAGDPSPGPSNSNPVNNPISYRSPSKFKKTNPPSFDGNRKLWPEFRAVWRCYAESEYVNNEERTWALKQALKGKAAEHVKAIFVTQADAYDRIWHRLESIYNDTSMSVQAVYNELKQLTRVREDNMKALVKFVNDVELIYSQLGEVSQLECITMTHIDDMVDLLPISIKKEWYKTYTELSNTEKIHPFSAFMVFLEKEREFAFRIAERDDKGNDSKHTSQSDKRKAFHVAIDNKNKSSNCLLHKRPNTTHRTENCTNFLDLTLEDRLKLLKSEKACFRCFGKHHRSNCNYNKNCDKCNKSNHHTLLHDDSKVKHDMQVLPVNSQVDTEDVSENNSSATFHSNREYVQSKVVFPIQEVKVFSSNKKASVMFDSGSNSTYITHSAAKSLKARYLGKIALDIITMGNKETKLHTSKYELKLVSNNHDLIPIIAYGIDSISGPIDSIDTETIKELFPHLDWNSLVRTSNQVDVLLGIDYCGLHPKQEIARKGDHLSVMKGKLGLCLQGSHPSLKFVKSIKSSIIVNHARITAKHNHQLLSFIEGENLGIEVTPKCGGCKCTKCPLVGHTFSFNEQQELDMIRNNMRYDSVRKGWVTKYPWIMDPNTLPDNYQAALSTLRNTERMLKKDETWAKVYHDQIVDMVTRNVAKKLSKDELDAWKGPRFYISHLAVSNPKSKSTPVRIVFNSSQNYHGYSLNGALAKGPDAYVNNLLGLLLRWRENKIVIIGDIRKMYNSIYIDEIEQHCHRFLWRDLDSSREPNIYIILRVNMGDKPAAAISTEAIYQTATLFEYEYPEVAKLLRHSTYVDDIIDSVESIENAINLAKNTELVLSEVGFSIKCWMFSQLPEQSSLVGITIEDNMLKGDDTHISVLGVNYDVGKDSISFQPTLNFSIKKKGQHISPDLMSSQVPACIPEVLTRRMVLEQTMRIFDPLGLLSPFTLKAKVYLRETWTCNLGWDDPIPCYLREKWLIFFQQLFEIESFSYSRVLKPENAIGYPDLVILSDAGDLAYGFAAYIRWELSDHTYWCRLILAKSKIAPIRKLSTPQMELNAAVLSKRGRKLIEKEMRFEFQNVYQLVDSETVLCMINKLSTRFKVYEGVRIGEIQSATDGDLSSWYWVQREQNIADTLTRHKDPVNISPQSAWFNGPAFLYLPFNQWNIKSHKDSLELLPGEKQIVFNNVAVEHSPLITLSRFSSARKAIWVLARVISVLEKQSFKGIVTENITVSHLEKAKLLLLKDAQHELHSSIAKYKRLHPVLNSDGLFVIGSRLTESNPLSFPDNKLPILLPSKHELTRMLMVEAHELCCHRGRDATLARFRMNYWTPQGSKLARSVRNNCQLCKLREPQLLSQSMGGLPLERLINSLPFSNIIIDYFGPYSVRGEINKRSTGKAYGVLFTDMYTRAVHIEGVYGYDTDSFLLALRRFVSLRGWPTNIFSDPGSQLVGAEKELVKIVSSLKRSDILKISNDNGTQWHFGPADSPWYQGAAEALIKSIKRCCKYIFNNHRVSPTEFSTICYEISNILNERPLGTTPSQDSTINVLTPNCMLLGRSMSRNPVIWDTNNAFKSRRHIVTEVSNRFWSKWSELYAPTLVVQNKWTKNMRNLQVGDVVTVCDSNAFKSQYNIGVVEQVYASKDGAVRKASIKQANFKKGGELYTYSKPSTIVRSVHRLGLLVPVGGED